MIEEKLNDIGFRDFVHLNKSLRDNKKRMAWNGVYKNNLIAFVIIFNMQKWELEKVICDNFQNSLNDYFTNRKNIEEVIDFIYRNCGVIPLNE